MSPEAPLGVQTAVFTLRPHAPMSSSSLLMRAPATPRQSHPGTSFYLNRLTSPVLGLISKDSDVLCSWGLGFQYRD